MLDRAANVPPVELPESDVKAGESLVVVGYGYPWPDSTEDFGPLERRFSEHRVTEVLKSGGRVAFDPPVRNSYVGAEGGPCLRQTGQGVCLAGILSTKVLSGEALFTSVYPCREWLRAEIRSAPVP